MDQPWQHQSETTSHYTHPGVRQWEVHSSFKMCSPKMLNFNPIKALNLIPSLQEIQDELNDTIRKQIAKSRFLQHSKSIRRVAGGEVGGGDCSLLK